MFMVQGCRYHPWFILCSKCAATWLHFNCTWYEAILNQLAPWSDYRTDSKTICTSCSVQDLSHVILPVHLCHTEGQFGTMVKAQCHFTWSLLNFLQYIPWLPVESPWYRSNINWLAPWSLNRHADTTHSTYHSQSM